MKRIFNVFMWGLLAFVLMWLTAINDPECHGYTVYMPLQNFTYVSEPLRLSEATDITTDQDICDLETRINSEIKTTTKTSNLFCGILFGAFGMWGLSTNSSYGTISGAYMLYKASWHIGRAVYY